MTILDQLKELADFEYCFEQDAYIGAGGAYFYRFGWKDGLHFYLDDYLCDDEFEKRFVGIVYKDQASLGSFNVSTIEECLVKFKKYISEHQPTQQ